MAWYLGRLIQNFGFWLTYRVGIRLLAWSNQRSSRKHRLKDFLP